MVTFAESPISMPPSKLQLLPPLDHITHYPTISNTTTTIHPPQPIHHNPSITVHPPQPIHHNPSTTTHPPQPIHHNPSTTTHPPQPIHHNPSTTINSRILPPTIKNLRTTLKPPINHLQIKNKPLTKQQPPSFHTCTRQRHVRVEEQVSVLRRLGRRPEGRIRNTMRASAPQHHHQAVLWWLEG